MCSRRLHVCSDRNGTCCLECARSRGLPHQEVVAPPEERETGSGDLEAVGASEAIRCNDGAVGSLRGAVWSQAGSANLMRFEGRHDRDFSPRRLHLGRSSVARCAGNRIGYGAAHIGILEDGSQGVCERFRRSRRQHCRRGWSSGSTGAAARAVGRPNGTSTI